MALPFIQIEKELVSSMEEARKIIQSAATSQGKLSPSSRARALDALVRARPLLTMAERSAKSLSDKKKLKTLQAEAFLLATLWKNTKVDFPRGDLGAEPSIPDLPPIIDRQIDEARTAIAAGSLDEARRLLSKAFEGSKVLSHHAAYEQTAKRLQQDARQAISILDLHEARTLIDDGMKELAAKDYRAATESGFKARQLSRSAKQDPLTRTAAAAMEVSASRLVASAPLFEAQSLLAEAAQLLKEKNLERAEDQLRRAYKKSQYILSWAEGLDESIRVPIIASATPIFSEVSNTLLSAAKLELSMAKTAFVDPHSGPFDAISASARASKIAADIQEDLKVSDPSTAAKAAEILAEADSLMRHSVDRSKTIIKRHVVSEARTQELEQATRRLLRSDQLVTQARAEAEAGQPEASRTAFTARKLAEEAGRIANDIKDPMISEPLLRRSEDLTRRSLILQKGAELSARTLESAMTALENAGGWLERAGELMAKDDASFHPEIRALAQRAAAAAKIVQSSVQGLPKAGVLTARADGIVAQARQILASL